MTEKTTFIRAIDQLLKNSGYLKKGGQTWYLDGEDILVVVNLQKIDKFFENQYAINIGFWLKKFGAHDFPKYNQCHLYYRVERLFPSEQALIRSGGSLSNSSSKEFDELLEFIKGRLVPFLQDCTQEKKLRELMRQGALNNGYVRLEARWYLTDSSNG